MSEYQCGAWLIGEAIVPVMALSFVVWVSYNIGRITEKKRREDNE